MKTSRAIRPLANCAISELKHRSPQGQQRLKAGQQAISRQSRINTEADAVPAARKAVAWGNPPSYQQQVN
jgi:hypothetical protein